LFKFFYGKIIKNTNPLENWSHCQCIREVKYSEGQSEYISFGFVTAKHTIVALVTDDLSMAYETEIFPQQNRIIQKEKINT
jgi:hypothetical protein